MPSTPHTPFIVQGPLSARPDASTAPEWLWYYAWDDSGGAFWRVADGEWRRATPVVEAAWVALVLEANWAADPAAAPRCRVAGDTVALQGIARGHGVAAQSRIAILPADCRPPTTVRLPAATDVGLAVVEIGADGALSALVAASGEPVPSVVHLDLLRFSRA